MERNELSCLTVFSIFGIALLVGVFIWQMPAPNESGQWAAWVQAFGSIGAILGGIYVVKAQHRLNQAAALAARKQRVDLLSISMRSVARIAYEAFKDLEQALDERKPAHYAEIRWRLVGALKILEGIDIVEFEDRRWVSPVLRLRGLLTEGCERTLERRDSPERNSYVLFGKRDANKMHHEARVLFDSIGELTQSSDIAP